MKKSVLTAAVLSLLPASAFAQVILQDVGFLQATTHVDLVSIQEGQLAVTDASNPAVKQFAQDMVATHTDANHTLAAMVPPVQLPLTTTKSPCMVWQAVLLSQKTVWTPYDAAYVQASVNNLQRQVNVMQGEAQAGSDPSLKNYAQKRLPIVQAQLNAALALQNAAPRPSTTSERDLFPSGSWQLSDRGKQALSDLAHHMAGTQHSPITVVGHTDTQPIGPELARTGVTTNEILSQKRADAVKDYLVSQGVPANMIQASGVGPADPVAPNTTPEGMQRNRRVDVTAELVTDSGAGLGKVAGVSACDD